MNNAHNLSRIDSKFLMSAPNLKQCPAPEKTEVAFAGRSNAGKSSVLNQVTGNKSLAKVSKTPGRTQMINFFEANIGGLLVDLPGYGYAKAAKTKIKTFQKIIKSYFTHRKQLISAFVLIDIRHIPQKLDLNFMYWLGEKKIPFSIIFTKCDKIKFIEIDSKINNYLDEMSKQWSSLPKYFVSSASRKTGINEILGYINKMNNLN